jgi:serine/threonine-protein kinase HipA
MSFDYDATWREASDPFPLSVSLPLEGAAAEGAAQCFFNNLLPEGELRRALCQRLGISESNDFELLTAIGGECAGAISLLPEGQSPGTTGEYRPLDLKALARAAGPYSVMPTIDGQDGMRLSLAGAQDKLPVLVDGKKFFLPVGASPSTHILKFPNERFKHLPDNELLVTEIARELGLPTSPAKLLPFGKQRAILIERYDRRVTGERLVERLHQEDLCQTLGLPPSRKYEQEGGPTFAQCYRQIHQHAALGLRAAQTLLRWQVFNALAFNADGHAKNLSLLRTAEGLVLAPFYDLVCTRADPRLHTGLAMKIGGVADPTLLLRASWERLAEEVGVRPSLVVDLVGELAEGFSAACDRASRRFKSEWGDSPALQLVLPKVRKQARRIAQQLEQ